MRYLNFDLLVEKSGDGFLARVLDAPAGQARERFAAPLSPIEAENLVLKIGRPRRRGRSFDTAPTQAAKDLGGTLFEAVFARDVRTCYQESLLQARSLGAGLRIRLRLDAPELADLPWEYLYNRALNSFMALARETSLVRYLELPRPLDPPRIDTALKVLAIISAPRDIQSLAGEEEWENLVKALAPLAAAGQVQLDRLQTPSLAALQTQLRRTPFHVIHFVGHGSFDERARDGALLFEDGHRMSSRVTAERLATLLHNHPSLRLVCLNCCEGARLAVSEPFSGVARSLIQQGVPAVIAMQFEISDGAAITFSNVFYESLADGLAVDAALVEARTAMYSGRDDVEFGAPVLFMRSPDGVLFHLHRPPAVTPLPAEPASPGVEPAAPPGFSPQPASEVPSGAAVQPADPPTATTLPPVPPPGPPPRPEHERERSGRPGRVQSLLAGRKPRRVAALAAIMVLGAGMLFSGARLRAARAEQVLVQAMRTYDGEAGRMDAVEARQLLEDAEERGSAVAAMWKAKSTFLGLLGYTKNPSLGQSLARRVAAEVESRARAGDALAAWQWASAETYGIGVGKDEKEGLVWDEKACNEGNLPVGCNNLAVAYQNGSGVAKDLAKAQELFERACTAGCQFSCWSLGHAYLLGQGVVKNLSRAAEIFGRACDRGEFDSCTSLGAMLERGDGGAAQPAKAAELYRRACDGGSFLACADLGGLLARGPEGVTPDAAKAAELDRRACDGDELWGCLNLGLLYEEGKIGSSDSSKAAELYRRACDGGEVNGCTNLGVLHELGKAGPPDPGKAAELYRRACDGGDSRGCTNLGLLYRNGKLGPADASQAAGFYRRGCDGGDTRGCNNLGFLNYEGQIGPKDFDKAAELYRRACDGGNLMGCSNLGIMTDLGEVGPKDPDKAVELFRRACTGGEMNGCAHLAEHYRTGSGVSLDKEEAKQLFVRACDGGDGFACLSLGAHFAPTQQASKAYLRRACTAGIAAACTS